MDTDNGLHVSSSVTNFELYNVDLRMSVTKNPLKLNDDKINIIYLTLLHYVKSLKKTSALQIGKSSITPNGSLINLGIISDKYRNINEHITSVS